MSKRRKRFWLHEKNLRTKKEHALLLKKGLCIIHTLCGGARIWYCVNYLNLSNILYVNDLRNARKAKHSGARAPRIDYLFLLRSDWASVGNVSGICLPWAGVDMCL